MAKIKYVGGSDEVYVTVNGADISFKRNRAVEVPDDVAGRPPAPRLMEAMLELHDAVANLDHEKAVKLRAEITGLDYGEGLLAQDIWQADTPKSDKKEDDK